MYSKTPIKDRIRNFVATIGLGNKPFEQQCHLSNGWVRLESEPTAKALAQIMREYPQLSPDWLLCGYGDMTRPLQDHPSVVKTTNAEENVDTIADQSNTPVLLAEPTQAYHGTKSKDITLPMLVYEELLNQLKKKDQQLEDAAAQIRTLLEMINTH